MAIAAAVAAAAIAATPTAAATPAARRHGARAAHAPRRRARHPAHGRLAARARPRHRRAHARGAGRQASLALSHPGHISRWAYVERSVPAREHPRRTARAVGTVPSSTFWGTSQIVLVLDRTRDGGRWSRVELPLPHRPPAWVPTSALSSLHAVHTWLKVNRESLTATLIRNGRKIFSAPVGVGQPQWPTPTGSYFIEVSLTPPADGGVYGPLAFGTTDHSDVLTEWPNEGQIGVHGTNEPWLIPGHISHGCIRLRNQDIVRLGHLMPVGTPVTVR